MGFWINHIVADHPRRVYDFDDGTNRFLCIRNIGPLRHARNQQRRLTLDEVLGQASWEEGRFFVMEPAGMPLPAQWEDIAIPEVGTEGAPQWMEIDGAVVLGEWIHSRFRSVSCCLADLPVYRVDDISTLL